MRHQAFTTVLALLLAVPGPAAAQDSGDVAADQPVVSTGAGTLAGAREDGVEIFRGVPYAAAPVGPNRWRVPQPVASWPGIRQATRFGADCMQDHANNPPPPGHAVPASEDCLFLNIWRPADAPAGPLPVMVWIHGGAFIMGSGAFSTYDGAALARKGVMVVTINYRLGRFGIFAVPDLLTEQPDGPVANYFLLDQIAALAWVRDNIAAFGGDPGNVTLFGESAGAVSINMLMTAPAARGLFHKAIAQSGSPRATLPRLAGPATSQISRDLAWAGGKGIADGDLSALRALPAEAVLDAPVTAVREPVDDGVLLARAPAIDFAAGDAAPVPYLIGANDYEESLLRWLPGALPAFERSVGDRLQAGLALYAAPGATREQMVGDMWGDMAMVEPARRTARQMAAQGVPVWLYHYSYVPEALRQSRPGAGHDNEIEMVFATASAAAAQGWSGNDQAMADLVSDYWVSFARTGNPNHQGAPQWPALQPDRDVLLEFGRTGPDVREDFRRAQLDFVADLSNRQD